MTGEVSVASVLLSPWLVDCRLEDMKSDCSVVTGLMLTDIVGKSEVEVPSTELVDAVTAMDWSVTEVIRDALWIVEIMLDERVSIAMILLARSDVKISFVGVDDEVTLSVGLRCTVDNVTSGW